MKIIKFSSQGDIERIAKYMINVMAASKIFDDEGNYVNQDTANGFPVFVVNDVEYSTRASAGFIYFTSGFSEKLGGSSIRRNFNELLTETILKIEFLYELHKLPWYNNKYKTVFNSSQTCIKIKTKKIDDVAKIPKKSINKSDCNENHTLHKNFEIIEAGRYSSDCNSKFKWKTLSLESEEDMVGVINMDETMIQKHIASILIDADNAVILEDNAFTAFLRYEHFTAQSNTITAENIILSPYGNPLLFYLNLKWRYVYEIFNNVSCSGLNFSYIFRKLLTPVLEAEYTPSLFVENDIPINRCQNCRSMLFDDVYVLFNRKFYGAGSEENAQNREKLVLCPLCLHFSLYPFECEYNYTLRMKIPVTVHDIIELSVVPRPHKEALHVVAELTSDELQYMNDKKWSIYKLERPNSTQGYAIANVDINVNKYGSDNRFSIVRASGYEGRKIIKASIV